MKIAFFGRGPVATPSRELLQQQPWCQLVSIDQPADVAVVVDYGDKLSQQVREQFPYGMINVHPSLLPRWRGPSPIKSALWHGDTTTGVTIMVIDDGFDTGPILAQITTAILPTETNLELEPRLAALGAKLLVQVLPHYLAGELKPVAQPTTGVTVSKMIKRADGELLVTMSAVEMWQRYRAFQPWPGVYFLHNGKRYKITQAHWEDTLVCDQIQPEGKQAMTLAEFKRGYPQVSFALMI